LFLCPFCERALPFEHLYVLFGGVSKAAGLGALILEEKTFSPMGQVIAGSQARPAWRRASHKNVPGKISSRPQNDLSFELGPASSQKLLDAG